MDWLTSPAPSWQPNWQSDWGMLNKTPLPSGAWGAPQGAMAPSSTPSGLSMGMRFPGGPMPEIYGRMSEPMFGGELSLLAKYLKENRISPAQWSAILNYMRQY